MGRKRVTEEEEKSKGGMEEWLYISEQPQARVTRNKLGRGNTKPD